MSWLTHPLPSSQHKTAGFRQQWFAKQFPRLFLSCILSINLITVPWSLRFLALDPQPCPIRSGLLTFGSHSTLAFTGSSRVCVSPSHVIETPTHTPTPCPSLVNKLPLHSPSKPILLPWTEKGYLKVSHKYDDVVWEDRSYDRIQVNSLWTWSSPP